MIRTWKERGLVLLTAVPLLGVAPPAAQADAPKPPPRPRTHAAPSKTKHTKHTKHTKPAAKKPHAKVALRTAAPRRDVLPGRTYEWKYRVVANGSARSGKAAFRTTLPKSLTFVSGERDCWTRGRTVACHLGTIGRGQEVAGVIRARVSNRAKPGRAIRLIGTAAWAGTRVTKRFPAVRVAKTADLALSQDAPSRARAGAKIPYAIKVRNLGPATAVNVTIRSTGPVKIVGRDTACLPYGRGYLCSVGTLRPGKSRTVHLRAVPRRDVRAGTVVSTSWRVSSATLDTDSANDSAVVRTKIAAPRRR